MPRVPRLPLVPDPLRRIHVPRDIKSITTVGHEEDPESLGVSLRTINRIWTAARELYKTGVHPAVQLCLRRNGRVVLDRAHRTEVMDVGSTPVWPATLSVAAPVLSRFMPSTVPETAVPSVPV